MVSKKEVERQLKNLGFSLHGWGRREVSELPNIILPGEVIFEAVNGIYEGGFALLLATDTRILLVDKKPLNYLTVEDMRFDMITEIDYSHRLVGCNITISASDKHLLFRSYNQPRLRKLIGHVQHRMAEIKNSQNSHQKDQKQHLEQINKQLQSYLIAQQQQQEKMYEHLRMLQAGKTEPVDALPAPLRPDRELADYLFAQGLLEQYQEQYGPPHEALMALPPAAAPVAAARVVDVPDNDVPTPADRASDKARQQLADLYAEGMKEIFGKYNKRSSSLMALTIDPLKIAYSKLPLALRNRKFGRPHFHMPVHPYKYKQDKKEIKPAT
jgi:hypothetical protein